MKMIIPVLILAISFPWMHARYTPVNMVSMEPGVSGSWKKIAQTVIYKDGRKTDNWKMLIKAQPCYASIIYSFMPDGSMNEDLSGCDKAIQKSVAALSGKGHWKKEGNKLIITSQDKTIPVAVYEISFNGSTMTWNFNYSENPSALNFKGKASSMIITYERVK